MRRYSRIFVIATDGENKLQQKCELEHKNNTKHDDVSKMHSLVKWANDPEFDHLVSLKLEVEMKRVNLFIVLLYGDFYQIHYDCRPPIHKKVFCCSEISLSRRNCNHMLKSRWRSELDIISVFLVLFLFLCMENG